MKRSTILAAAAILLHSAIGCTGQSANRTVQPNNNAQSTSPESFENSRFTYIGIPEKINPTDTSLGWTQKGQKLLLNGKIFKGDGTTPAADVVLYYYHTNTEGRYIHKPEEPRSMPPSKGGQTHGYIRGWVKTDTTGDFSIYTVRPGSYPESNEPAHIHLTIKEPNKISEYYIDDIVFDDDESLTADRRMRLENRGGTGIVKLAEKADLQIATRNIILGHNIPDYPSKLPSEKR